MCVPMLVSTQEEEVETVQWFDLEDVYEECRQHNEKFCVPQGGISLIREFININNL